MAGTLASLALATMASGSARLATPTCISQVDACKLFGRLADKQLFMDESAGSCCHSGCDGCPYRYSFDVLEAVAPKWLPTYARKTIGDREHVPLFMTNVFGGDERVSEDTFVDRILDLDYQQPIGPALPAADRIALKNDPALSRDVVRAFFRALSGDGEAVSKKEATRVLRQWAVDASGEKASDGLLFGSFVSAVTTALAAS